MKWQCAFILGAKWIFKKTALSTPVALVRDQKNGARSIPYSSLIFNLFLFYYMLYILKNMRLLHCESDYSLQLFDKWWVISLTWRESCRWLRNWKHIEWAPPNNCWHRQKDCRSGQKSWWWSKMKIPLFATQDKNVKQIKKHIYTLIVSLKFKTSISMTKQTTKQPGLSKITIISTEGPSISIEKSGNFYRKPSL